MMGSPENLPHVKKAPPARKISWGSLLIVTGYFAPLLAPVALLGGLWSVRARLFPAEGRVARSYYWNALGIYFFAGGLLALLIVGLSQETKLPGLIIWSLYALLVGPISISAVMIALGRLRDRNIPGWWLIIYYGLPMALIAGCCVRALPDAVRILLGVPVPYLLIWTIVALGCRRGTIGSNPYGADPVVLEYERVRERQHAAASKAAEAKSAAPMPAASAMRAPQSVAIADVAAARPQAGSLPPPLPIIDHRGTIRRVVDDLFSFHGRFSQAKYWMYFAVQCAFVGIAWTLIDAATKTKHVSSTAFWALVGVLAVLPAAVSIAATSIKRCHDYDWSGWWVAGFCGFAFIIYLFVQDGDASDLGGALGLAGFVLICIGSGRGTIGANRFGPDTVPPPRGVAETRARTTQ
jgi:uncharacterized membrane protein YhaH (DUF805 family)